MPPNIRWHSKLS